MDIRISIGEWMKTLQERMIEASDGDCFCLPTEMHLHAFGIVKEKFPNSKIIPFNELVSTVISIFGVASIEYYKESAIMSKTCNKYLFIV